MNNVNQYPYDFKIRIVEEVLTGQITKEECRRRYGIKGRCTVLKWIRKFAPDGQVLKMKDSHAEIDILRKKLKLLKKELEYERLKSESYLEDLKIPIRKKSGAKQSKK